MLTGSVTFIDMLLSIVAVVAILALAWRDRAVSKRQWVIVALSVFLSLRYLVWRGLHTLNTSDPVSLGLSLLVFAAELYGFGGTLFFYLQILNPVHREAPTPDPTRRPSVDVFVTIYSEPIEVLKRTLVACRAMEYPPDRKTIYVLDDGGRAEVRELAALLGCVYLHRPTREHAKAGNLNYALARSQGELIVSFDTDHVPVRSFLMETIGFFEEPKVALVQTPHHFYNPDMFQRNLRLERHLVNEQDLFFQIVQPGRDGHNSVFFCGSGGLFRRGPLEEIGGFVTESVTEDIHTSIVLHAKGYRSVYLNKRLSAGLAPESYASYLRQRQRWTRGHLQIFLSRHNPLLIRGLTLAQRFDYLASIYYFMLGPARLIYMVGPLAYLLFGKYVVVADATSLLTFYVAHYVGAVAASGALTKGFRNPFWSDVYETVMSFHLTLTAVATILFIRRAVFHVTPKGVRSSRTSFQALQSLPYVLIVGATVWGLVAGLVEVARAGHANTAAVISLLWGGYNLLIGLAVITAARERPQRREASRLAREIPCELRVGRTMIAARTFDLSETGLQLFLNPPRFLPTQVDVRLTGDDGEVTMLTGEVVRNDRVGERHAFVGIQFRRVTEEQVQSLIRQMYSSPSSWAVVPVSDTRTWPSWVWLCTASIRAFAKERALRRLAPRFTLEVPCEIVSRDHVLSGVTEDMSETGLLIRCPGLTTRLSESCVVRLTPGMDLFTLRGRVVWQRATVGGLVIGVRCEEPLSRFLITWIESVQNGSRRGQPSSFSEPTPTG